MNENIPENHISHLVTNIIEHLDPEKTPKEIEVNNKTFKTKVLLQPMILALIEEKYQIEELERLCKEDDIYKELSDNTDLDLETLTLFKKEQQELIREALLRTMIVGSNMDVLDLKEYGVDNSNFEKVGPERGQTLLAIIRHVNNIMKENF
ncbi:MAG: hypothetical protein Q4Q23_03210 [Methanobacteriaceae archaeon]|nr:hypothetical protein [Methanobacteriaceae archaeon]